MNRQVQEQRQRPQRRRASFKPVLYEVLKQGRFIHNGDKVHVKKWLSSEAANDHIPEPIVTDPIKRCDIIAYALDARRHAEAAAHGRDPAREQNQKDRLKRSELAQKAEDLASYFRSVEPYQGIADYYERFLLPLRSLWMLHEYEAQLLRPHPLTEPGPTTFISRQTGGGKTKKKRVRSREYNAFIMFMVMRMQDEFDRPYYGTVAILTNMVYPEAAVSTEDVEAVWRRGQAYIRRNTRALNPKKSG
jgi:hypothetical protein